MPDNQDQIIENLQNEIVDLKIRIKRLEEFILDNFSISDPRDYIYESEEGSSEFDQAIRLIVQYNTASASFLQRKLMVGYARAARLLDTMEEKGFVSPADGAKPREVYIHAIEEYLKSQSKTDVNDNKDHSEEDELYKKAVEFTLQQETISTSILQKKMNIGYARAARLLDQMEEDGIVGTVSNSKPRKVLKSAKLN